MAIVLKGVDRVSKTDVEITQSLKVVSKEFSWEKIAVDFESNFAQTALGFSELAPGDIALNIWEDENTLDGGVAFQAVGVYLPDSSVSDVINEGSQVGGAVGGTIDKDNDNYAYYFIARPGYWFVLKEGQRAYILFNGDSAPTSGKSVIKSLVIPA